MRSSGGVALLRLTCRSGSLFGDREKEAEVARREGSTRVRGGCRRDLKRHQTNARNDVETLPTAGSSPPLPRGSAYRLACEHVCMW